MIEFLAVLIAFFMSVVFFLLTALMFAWPLFVMALVVYVIYKLMKRNNRPKNR